MTCWVNLGRLRRSKIVVLALFPLTVQKQSSGEDSGRCAHACHLDELSHVSHLMHMDTPDRGSVLVVPHSLRLATWIPPCYLVCWKSVCLHRAWLFIKLNFYLCINNNGSRPENKRRRCDAVSRGFFAMAVRRWSCHGSFTPYEGCSCSFQREDTIHSCSIWNSEFRGCHPLTSFGILTRYFSPPSAVVLPSWYPSWCPFERGEGKHSVFCLLGKKASLNLKMSPLQVISKVMLPIVS